MQHKHLEFVFLSDTTQTYRISDDMVRRFHDNDQITQWQQNAFPKERPRVNSRSHKEDGLLQDGDPVFFLLDDEGHVKFFGRAQNFRLLYPYAPYDFVPSELRNPEITDMAEAIFGYVPMDDGKTKDNRQAYAGRVFVADAPLKEGQDAAQIWLTGDQGSYIVPRILGGPKPTTFQHYLVQEQEERRELKHYASTPGEDTVIRGHKLYWHQGHTQDWKSHLRHPDTQPGSEGSQHTGICPVQPGVYFELNIRFENLSDVELGALLWVLRLATNENHALKLGMGKPLGMGSVRVNTLIVKESDRERRYTSLFDEHGNWETGDTTWDAQAQQASINAFQAYVYENSGETVGSFDELPRVRTLLHLLNWPGPEASATRYMELGEFRNRPVLPTPADVMDDTKNGGEPPTRGQRQQPSPPKKPELNTEQRIKGKVEAVKSNYYTVALPDNVWGRLGVPRSDVEQVRLERTDDVPRLGKGASTPNCVAVKVEDGTLYIRVAPKKKE
jgi:CRISPR-associated protein (TIGR03986 family)